MSKLDKNIQDARSWVKKHAEATDAVVPVKTALTAWEGKIQKLEQVRAELDAAKNATVAARKSVSEAVKQAKKSLAKTPVQHKKLATPKKPATPKEPAVSQKPAAKKSTAKVTIPQATKPQS